MASRVLFYEEGRPVYSDACTHTLTDWGCPECLRALQIRQSRAMQNIVPRLYGTEQPECGDIVENFIQREAAKAGNRRPHEVDGGGVVVLALGLLILFVGALFVRLWMGLPS